MLLARSRDKERLEPCYLVAQTLCRDALLAVKVLWPMGRVIVPGTGCSGPPPV